MGADHKLGPELWVPVMDYLLGNSVQSKDVVTEEPTQGVRMHIQSANMYAYYFVFLNAYLH